MKLAYLETELYRRLKGMQVTEERLTFMRYQARKLLAKPMLRGDIVLPYIIAIFIFEVLCDENISQCSYSGTNITYAESCQKCDSDKQLGYNCALVTLGKRDTCYRHFYSLSLPPKNCPGFKKAVEFRMNRTICFRSFELSIKVWGKYDDFKMILTEKENSELSDRFFWISLLKGKDFIFLKT